MLKEKLSNDIKTALKGKKELELLVLRGVSAVIKNKEIEKRDELIEEEVIQIFLSEAKKRKDSIEEFKKGNREDLVEKEKKELEILKKYLPEQMSEDQIKEEVKKVIKKVGAVGSQEIGKVMSVLMPKLKGKVDGKVVSKLVGELLK